MKLIMFCTIYSMKIKKKRFKNKVTPEAFWMDPCGLWAGMICAFNLKNLKQVF